MTQTILNLETQIKKHTQELKALEEQLREAKLQSPDKQLATELHSLLCQWNHTDGCGWFYEFKDKKDDWNGSAHGRYLAKAQKFIHKCEVWKINPGDAIALYKMVKEL